MAAELGIAVGTANSGIAVAPAPGSVSDDTAFTTLSRPTVLQVSEDGTPSLPGPTAGGAGTPVTGFVERVGDPVGLLDDAGRVHLGEDLFAATVAGLIEAGSAADEDSPAAVVVTHPTTWNGYTVAALAAGLDRAGLSAARLVPEALACAHWLDAAHGPQGDGVVVVYDLGASGLDITVVRTGPEPSLLGRPLRSEEFAGDGIDHLVTRHVLDALAGRTDHLDPFDAATTAALLQLRRRCTDAKEALSTDTETTLPVSLPGIETDVRLVRAELEDLIREPLSKSLELVREALRAAEVDSSDVSAVLLAGGGGSIPLVAELVSSELGLTVVAAPDPARTAALGAARLAGDTPVEATPPVAADDDGLPRPAASAVVPSFPTRMHSTRSGSSMRRRIAVVASAAAAIALLTAGGLTLGTPSTPAPAQSSSTDVGTSTSAGAPTTAGGDDRPVSHEGTSGAVTVGGSGTGTPVPALAGTPSGGAAAGTAGSPAAPGAPAPASNTVPDAPAGNAPLTPGGTEPGGGTPPPVFPPSAPSGGGAASPVVTGPSPSDVGQGIGQAAAGVGQGLGAVVGGIGTGVTGVVGAVVDPVTGLLLGP